MKHYVTQYIDNAAVVVVTSHFVICAVSNVRHFTGVFHCVKLKDLQCNIRRVMCLLCVVQFSGGNKINCVVTYVC